MHTHVNIDPGLTNLERTYKYLEQNPVLAVSIGNNGYVFAEKYLTPDAIKTHLSGVIHDLNDAFRATA